MCGSLNSLYDLEVPGSSQCECLFVTSFCIGLFPSAAFLEDRDFL